MLKSPWGFRTGRFNELSRVSPSKTRAESEPVSQEAATGIGEEKMMFPWPELKEGRVHTPPALIVWQEAFLDGWVNRAVLCQMDWVGFTRGAEFAGGHSQGARAGRPGFPSRSWLAGEPANAWMLHGGSLK